MPPYVKNIGGSYWVSEGCGVIALKLRCLIVRVSASFPLTLHTRSRPAPVQCSFSLHKGYLIAFWWSLFSTRWVGPKPATVMTGPYFGTNDCLIERQLGSDLISIGAHGQLMGAYVKTRQFSLASSTLVWCGVRIYYIGSEIVLKQRFQI